MGALGVVVEAVDVLVPSGERRVEALLRAALRTGDRQCARSRLHRAMPLGVATGVPGGMERRVRRQVPMPVVAGGARTKAINAPRHLQRLVQRAAYVAVPHHPW